MKNRRKKYLIEPRVQLLAAVILTGTGALGLLLLAVLNHATLANTAARFADVNPRFVAEVNAELQHNLLVALLASVPLTVAAGIAMTFRLVGPLYRMRAFLDQISRGERPDRCRIRSRDELHGLCEALNEAVATLRGNREAEERTKRIAGAAELCDDVPTLVEEGERDTSSRQGRRASA